MNNMAEDKEEKLLLNSLQKQKHGAGGDILITYDFIILERNHTAAYSSLFIYDIRKRNHFLSNLSYSRCFRVSI